MCVCLFVFLFLVYVDAYISMVICILYVCGCDSSGSRLCTYIVSSFFSNIST